MPADAKLCWITREQRALLMALWKNDEEHPPIPVAVAEVAIAFDAAPEPVERLRCVVHDAEHWNGFLCWRGMLGVNDPCRFVTMFEVPAPSQPEPPDEATT